MLLFTPGRIPRGTSVHAIHQLVDRVTEHFGARGVMLAQMLIDPADVDVISEYLKCGFSKLAELVYLHRTAARRFTAPSIPAGLAMHTYSAQTHEQFSQAIRRSYESSLDCPALNGLRNIEDVIAGHKSGTEFDPNLWIVLTENQRPIAVLLLGRSHGDALELVYLGLAPEARGRGIGDWLMQLALMKVSKEGRARLSLAVDSSNAPALALYYRHGMKRIGARVALLKTLTEVIAPAAKSQIAASNDAELKLSPAPAPPVL
jgi:ribosomal protein S18 acetylase RimI-like enzyme